MPSPQRYEILNTIAVGDFATVCRARDRALGREVAVKQIHPHFLQDERQLARYWQEAQLLATLQHPNVVTIYDIVRDRGWLILELMRGDLSQLSHGEPIDLDFLRMSMAGALQALHFLHTNGVIHGDVKPSNMLVDAQGHVKLGDFGLARRASSESGSLLKGTTKYMAPELVSDQFGAVGPASDLYSLGFSAYELMCGAQFESLFPGLGALGRDRQIAWMLWHAAPDRHLPEVSRVLEGVPDDLARVVQKLTAKDPAQRYASARDALRDLQVDSLLSPLPPAEENAEQIAAEVAAARRKRRKRWIAVAAMVCSLAISAIMLLPTRKQPADTEPRERPATVTEFDELGRKLYITYDDTTRPGELSIKPRDRFYVNDQERSIREILAGEHVVIERAIDPQDGRILKIHATRADISQGRITELQADKGEMVVESKLPDGRDEKTPLYVPHEAAISLNGQKERAGNPLTLADLQSDDRVVVHHVGSERGREAKEIEARRIVSTEGVIRNIDAETQAITFDAAADGGNASAGGASAAAGLITLPLAANAQVVINGRDNLDGQLFKSADLRPDDHVRVMHDTEITRIEAQRVLSATGVVRRVHYDARTLDLAVNTQVTTFLAPPQCQITIGGKPAAFDDLRDGDRATVEHASLKAATTEATSIAATRPADPRRWALLVANQSFDDATLTPIPHSFADATALRDALVERYRVPADQAFLLTDESLVRLRQAIPERLGRMRDDARVVVYLAGHAYRDANAKPGEPTIYYAPKNFDLKQIATTGLSLQWLVDQLESCSAQEKVLLLDCTQSGAGADLQQEPSTAEMVRALHPRENRALLRTVTAIASCRTGQRGLPAQADGAADAKGAFGESLIAAFRGAADKNHDSRLEPTELFAFLAAEVPAGNRPQNPELFLPDDHPPRLTPAAQQAVRAMAALLRQDRIDRGEVSDRYGDAAALVGKELDAKLIYALIFMKLKDRDEAIQRFEQIHVEQPDAILPLMALAWLQCDRRAARGGSAIEDLLAAIAKTGDVGAAEMPPMTREALLLAGRLREYAGGPAMSAAPQSLDALDAAARALGPAAEQVYRQGRDEARAQAVQFDERIANAPNEAMAKTAQYDRLRLTHYAVFPLDAAIDAVLEGLSQ